MGILSKAAFKKIKLDWIILIFLVIVSSVFSGKHRTTAPSSSETENTGHDSDHESVSTSLGVASEDLQNSASKYSAKYSAANLPYVSLSDTGDYYAYHNTPSVTYAKSYASPSTSSIAGVPGTTYYSYNSLMDAYPGYFHDRSPREFSTRQSAPSPVFAHQAASPPEFPPLTTGAFNPAPVSNNYNFVDPGPEYAEVALASSGGGGHGQGNGWGWRKGKSQGHGWVNHYVSKVNTDAIGLLGLLGLLSLLSNVLLLFTTTTTTTTAAGRRKRSVEVTDTPNPFETVNRVSASVLPSLTLLAHARSGRIPLNCTHLEVCKTNRILVREFGFLGRPIGSRISIAISKLLHEVDPTGDIKNHVHKAGVAGRNVENCEKIYPICDALSQVGRPALPVLIRVEDLPAIIQGKYPTYINPLYIPKYL